MVRRVTDAFSYGELEEAADAVEVGMNARDLGKGLRVDCTFKASGPETASLLSEGVEPTEIVLVDAE